MKDFRPTYLYIKQHAVTGKLYFGKTTAKDPVKYTGSGKYWSNHIKYHGKEHVKTLWYELFIDRELLIKTAVDFSELHDIVKSELWLNLKLENGIDGNGVDFTPEIRAKMSAARKRYVFTDAHREKMSINCKNRSAEIRQKISDGNKGKIVSNEAKEKISKALKGVSKPEFSSEHKMKIALAQTGKKRGPFSAEHLANLSKAAKNRSKKVLNEID